VKEYDLPGVKTCDLRLFPDERGFFSEALRSDWLLGEDGIAQASGSKNPWHLLAWHKDCIQ